MAILFLPVQFFMFVFLGATKGLVVVWKLFAINFQKYGEKSRNAFRAREGFGACCPCINSYVCYFFITLIGCIVAVPCALVIYPLYGAFHACKISCKLCFVESDMAEEARPDKGGIVANIFDRAGWTDTEKEKFAEVYPLPPPASAAPSLCRPNPHAARAPPQWFGSNFFGYITLLVGDWFTLTGMGEAFKSFMEGYEFHDGVLDTLARLLSSFDWLESIGIKGYVEVNVVPLKTIGKAMSKAIAVQYDAYAFKKGFKSATEWEVRPPVISVTPDAPSGRCARPPPAGRPRTHAATVRMPRGPATPRRPVTQRAACQRRLQGSTPLAAARAARAHAHRAPCTTHPLACHPSPPTLRPPPPLASPSRV